MTNFVQLYKSTDQNAPTLTGQTGSLITLLNKCLVDGFSTATLATLTRGGTGNTTALAKMSVADATLVTGHYVAISGCTSTGAATYNITAAIKVASIWLANTSYTQGALVINDTGKTYVMRVASGTSAASGGPTGTGSSITDNSCTWDYVDAVGNNTLYFSYQMSTDPGANASGSPAYARASLGWTRPFSAGTNSQTYRSADNTSNQFYLQIIDNAATAGGAKEAQVFAAEVMTSDQTVSSGRFPLASSLANGQCFRKSTTADATARAWTLWGDDRTFYFVNNTGDGVGFRYWPLMFGYYISFKPGDAFNTMVGSSAQFNSGNTNTNQAPVNSFAFANSGSFAIASFSGARTAAQIGGGVGLCCSFPGQAGGSSGIGYSLGNSLATVVYPNAADAGVYIAPIFLQEAGNNNSFQTSNLRGRLPGWYVTLALNPFTLYDTLAGVSGLSGVTLTYIPLSSVSADGHMMADTFGPWT